jgi:acetate---CoA ligase (ADP-forming)
VKEQAPPSRLRALFNPRSIAILGARQAPHISQALWESIRSGGYPGTIHLVNPNRTEIYGERCHANVLEISEPVELGLITVGEKFATVALEDCIAAGIGSVILYTDFSDSPEGRARRQAVTDLARSHGIAMCGSVSLGLFDRTTAFMPIWTRPYNRLSGPIGIICQSGGLFNAVCGGLDDLGVGVGRAVATGGEDVLAIADYIEYFLEAGDVGTIGCIAEQIKDLPRFRRAVEQARRAGVPIVMLKTGRTKMGEAAARAHSGALTHDQALIQGLFRQLGIVQAKDLTEIINLLALSAKAGPRFSGKRACILTISGGETALAADIAEENDMTLSTLAEETRAALQKELGTRFEFGNPVDVANGSLRVLSEADAYVRAVELILEDPNTDVVLARSLDDPAVFEGLKGLAEKQPKPLILYSRLTTDILNFDRSRLQADVPFIPGVSAAVATTAALLRGSEALDRPLELRPVPLPVELREQLDVLLRARRTVLTEDLVFPILAQCGLHPPDFRVVARGDDAAGLTDGMAAPFVVKILSEKIIHRRSAGGVMTGLRSEAEVAEAVTRLFAEFAPSDVERVIVEAAVRFDLEVFFGARRLPDGSRAIVCGWGGTFVEDIATASVRLSPLYAADPDDMLEETGLAASLSRIGGKSAPELVARLREALLAFDALAVAIGDDLAEFDINPIGIDVRAGLLRVLDAKILLQ